MTEPAVPRGTPQQQRLLNTAEQLYQLGRFTDAIRVYASLALGRSAPLAHFATYRIAWCYRRLKRHRLSLASFVQVARIPGVTPTLRWAALWHQVPVYAVIGRPSLAYRFYLTITGNRPAEAKRLLHRLGTEYQAKGMNIPAIKVFNEQLKRWPRDTARCRWAEAVVESCIVLAGRPAIVKALEKMARVYVSLSKQLGAKNVAVTACSARTKGYLVRLSRQWRREVVKGRPSNLHYAKRLESLHHKTFGVAP